MTGTELHRLLCWSTLLGPESCRRAFARWDCECLALLRRLLVIGVQLVAGQPEADKELLQLRHSLEPVPNDSALPIAEEEAVIDGEERLARIDARIRKALRVA